MEAFERIVGPERLLVGDAIPRRYASDMLLPLRAFPVPEPCLPAAVARPVSTEEVSALLRAAAAEGRRVLPWGGGTNLMGSCRPLGGELVLDLALMNRIEIDPANEWARVGAGARVGDVEAEAGRHGLIFGHDPWTREEATVGGAFATDGLGYLAPRYGSMARMVLGLTAVLADGTIVRRRASRKSSVGFDLAALLAGTEGTLAVATEFTVALRPAPERREILAFEFESFESGFAACCRLMPVEPSILDFGESWPLGRLDVPFGPQDAGPILYVGFEGPARVVDAKVDEAVRRVPGRRLDEAEGREYWQRRHDIALRFRRDDEGRCAAMESLRNTLLDYVHVSLPRSRVLEFRRRVLEDCGLRGILPLDIGIWVAPELLSVVLIHPAGEENRKLLRETLEGWLSLCHAMGGSMEYCHGVGMRLAHLLPAEHGAALAVQDRIKRALDPRGLLPHLGRTTIRG